MNPIVKSAWVAALRSGQYKQVGGGLRINHSFCCLGVLCDIHAKLHGKPWEAEQTPGYYSYFGAVDYLPNSVSEWAGLEHNGAPVWIRQSNLASLNDAGQSFERIAEVIGSR